MPVMYAQHLEGAFFHGHAGRTAFNTGLANLLAEDVKVMSREQERKKNGTVMKQRHNAHISTHTQKRGVLPSFKG